MWSFSFSQNLIVLSSLHLCEGLEGFSLACYTAVTTASVVGATVTRIGVVWTRALQFHESRLDNRDGLSTCERGGSCPSQDEAGWLGLHPPTQASQYTVENVGVVYFRVCISVPRTQSTAGNCPCGHAETVHTHPPLSAPLRSSVDT